MTIMIDITANAGYSQPWAVGAGTADGRPWVVSGDTFGLMAWTTANAAYDLFYKVRNTKRFLVGRLDYATEV